MDESWRIRMVMPSRQRRRSMETQEPDDFDDVFGGPPRSVLQRRFSGDFPRSSSSSSSSLYEEVFGHHEFLTASTKGGGRSLPAFRIPAKGEGFYSDVFGAEESGRRSRERSRPNSMGKSNSNSNSSSVLSSEELSPLRHPETGDDAAFFYPFASKIRPINAPCRWNSATKIPEGQPGKQGMPSFPCDSPSYMNDYHIQDDYSETLCGSYYKVSQQVSSPEIINLEPQSYRSFKVSAEDLELNSPPSPVSSLCNELPETKEDTQCDPTLEEEMEQDGDDDETMSSYVIEINSDYREVIDEAICIDEAIAWAKEKYQTQSSVKIHEEEHSATGQESYSTNEFMDQEISDQQRTQSLVEEELKKWTREEKKQAKEDVERELLDEDLKLWSAGKETNIRLLLSTLHHILWPNSGWHAISLTKLIESSHVKKAYQKARLCLHPDKLQQRQATLPQKHVAEKAFSVLQDAWDAFISHDVLF